METDKRIGVIAILITDRHDAVPRVNALLSEFGDLVVGRIGVPYRERQVNVISLIVDGTTDELGAFSGKLGMISGVTSKTLLLSKT